MATSLRPLLFALVIAAAGCSATAEPGARVEGKTAMPFALDRTRSSFAGTVREVLPAGGYTYARVDDRWVVTLKKLAVGDRVSVKGFGEKSSFHSARLSRTFDHLVFAVVTFNQEGT
jgi:hypothetical protein